MNWIFNYQKTEAIDSLESGQIFPSSPDQIKFKPSSLALSSDNPWQDANTRTVIWDYKVQNTSSSSADNVWIHIDFPANFTINSVVNNATGGTLTQQADLYLLGGISSNSTANLSISGTFTSCDTVLMTVYSGFECTGYPTDFASFECNYESLVLYVEPKPSFYQTRLSSNLMPDPCSPQVELIVDITSVKTAHMYDMTVGMVTPDTNKIKILDGYSEFQYNISNNYAFINDPVFAVDSYLYEVNSYDPSFAADGIPGVMDVNNNRYRLKTTIELGNQFVQGDFIEIHVNGSNACDVSLPTIKLAYDPNTNFEKDNTAGLHLDLGNSWSASWGDYDNDGFDDLFVPINDINEPNILYHNEGDGTFTKVASGTIVTDLGASISGTWGDYDNDGYLDLFVTNNVNSENKLYHNNGDGTFISILNNPVVDNGIYSHSAAWADYNQDGNLDLVVTDFHPTHFNFLYYGDGNGGFAIDESSEISLSATSAVGASWGDFDNDGDLDLFIANTNGENNQLFQNDNGIMIEITSGDIVSDGGNSVGGIWGDYDNDGDLDLYVTNTSMIESNFFYENNGDGTFTTITTGPIVENMSNSHGASWIDYDNDGDLDLLVANDQSNQNFMFANNGDKTFLSMYNAITDDNNNSYGTAWSDYDNDGDYDLFVSNIGSSTNDFFVNQKGSCTNHIVVKLQGCNSNSYGIGAMVKVKATINGSEVWQTKHVSTQTSGMGGQNSSNLLFGLMDANTVDSIIVQWPSGVITYMLNPVINQQVLINEDCGSKVSGTVYYDANSNGIQDTGEYGIPNQKLIVTPGEIQVFTDQDGYYQLYLDDGTYSIDQEVDPDWTQVYPTGGMGYFVNVLQSDGVDYDNKDFGNSSICTDPDLTVNVGATAFRLGLTNQLNVVVFNNGSVAANDLITVDVTLTANTYLVGGGWTNMVDNITTRTYTYNVTLIDALSDTTLMLTDSVDASASIDELVTVSTSVTYGSTECDIMDNDNFITDVVVGSIDPNDKQVFVEGKGLSNYCEREDTLVYKIRFQNVGNYAARRVLIIDTLSANLDWSSFEFIGSSHPFSYSLINGILTFVNENIELPDSTSDLEGSMGYVSFCVSPKNDVEAFVEVKNTARIQFDYNEFIVTNSVGNIVGPSIDRDENTVIVYPNPTSISSSIHLIDKDNLPLIMSSIVILDLNGREILNKDVGAEKYSLNVNQIESGVYFVVVSDEFGEQYNTKLVVTK